MSKSNKTTIQVDKETLELIKGKKIIERETYNDTIKRLIKSENND